MKATNYIPAGSVAIELSDLSPAQLAEVAAQVELSATENTRGLFSKVNHALQDYQQRNEVAVVLYRDAQGEIYFTDASPSFYKEEGEKTEEKKPRGRKVAQFGPAVAGLTTHVTTEGEGNTLEEITAQEIAADIEAADAQGQPDVQAGAVPVAVPGDGFVEADQQPATAVVLTPEQEKAYNDLKVFDEPAAEAYLENILNGNVPNPEQQEFINGIAAGNPAPVEGETPAAGNTDSQAGPERQQEQEGGQQEGGTPAPAGDPVAAAAQELATKTGMSEADALALLGKMADNLRLTATAGPAKKEPTPEELAFIKRLEDEITEGEGRLNTLREQLGNARRQAGLDVPAAKPGKKTFRSKDERPQYVGVSEPTADHIEKARQILKAGKNKKTTTIDLYNLGLNPAGIIKVLKTLSHKMDNAYVYDVCGPHALAQAKAAATPVPAEAAAQ